VVPVRVKPLRGESRWLNPNITAFKRDPSSPAAPQDDIYGTFSVISDRFTVPQLIYVLLPKEGQGTCPRLPSLSVPRI